MSPFSRKKVYGDEKGFDFLVTLLVPLLIHSESTPCSHNTKVQAALRVFPILTFTLCSTWFVMTRNRNVCCS